MTQFAMTTRTGSVVIKTKADNLEEAINYFAKMKQLPRKEFLKLFMVTKVL
tara:strand:+ start:190 stop:342 length:153 start_codon:yes stop_codon:yes gene_type:complete